MDTDVYANIDELGLKMVEATQLECAYLAGFIDGEGTVTSVFRKGANGRHEAVHIRLSIPNTNFDILEWIQLRFGGELHYLNSIPKKSTYKKVYSLYWGGNKCVPVLKATLPYLQIKRRQAEILLCLNDLVLPREGGARRRGVKPWHHSKRKGLVEELKALNFRGVPIILIQETEGVQ